MSLIEIKSLSKIYDLGEVQVKALDDVTLTIERGEFLSVMGPSGSGKSTLMNIVGCLDKPSTGEYLLEGVDVGRMSRDELATVRNKKIGRP